MSVARSATACACAAAGRVRAATRRPSPRAHGATAVGARAHGGAYVATRVSREPRPRVTLLSRLHAHILRILMWTVLAAVLQRVRRRLTAGHCSGSSANMESNMESNSAAAIISSVRSLASLFVKDSLPSAASRASRNAFDASFLFFRLRSLRSSPPKLRQSWLSLMRPEDRKHSGSARGREGGVSNAGR